MASSSGKSYPRALRHLFCCSFKDSSSEGDIKRVIDSLLDLPSKVLPSVVIDDLQWGTNNSTEGLDDGLTHCFFMTFANEEARDAYLPHPAHVAFGDMIRPYMDKIFVVDYWTDPAITTKTPPSECRKELKHGVFFRFKEGAGTEDVDEIQRALADLPSKIDAVNGFEWGRNVSPEKFDDGFTHCFMLTFHSEEDREIYLNHPEHVAFVDLLKPCLERARVLDFWDETH